MAFTPTTTSAGVDFLNNTACRNRTDFNFLGRRDDNRTDIPGRGHHARNNLAFEGGRSVAEIDQAACDSSHNSWDIPLALKASDFLSLDEAELVRPRQPDGSLPAITFMHLAPGSAAIDRGVDIGRPFSGSAPDLGAFESTPASMAQP